MNSFDMTENICRAFNPRRLRDTGDWSPIMCAFFSSVCVCIPNVSLIGDAHTHTHTHTHTHRQIHTHTNPPTHTCQHTHPNTHTHTHKHMPTHTHTHTHTQLC